MNGTTPVSATVDDQRDPVNDAGGPPTTPCPPWKTRRSRATLRPTTPRRVTAATSGRWPRVRPTARSRWAPTAASSHPERRLQRSGQLHLHHHRRRWRHLDRDCNDQRRADVTPRSPGRRPRRPKTYAGDHRRGDDSDPDGAYATNDTPSGHRIGVWAAHGSIPERDGRRRRQRSPERQTSTVRTTPTSPRSFDGWRRRLDRRSRDGRHHGAPGRTMCRWPTTPCPPWKTRCSRAAWRATTPHRATAATSGPGHGSVQRHGHGGRRRQLQSYPERRLQRSDSFTYTITDADGDISTATATISGDAGRRLPVAADTLSSAWRHAAHRAAGDNDTRRVTAATSGPGHGDDPTARSW